MDFFNSVWDSHHDPYSVKHVIYPPLIVFEYYLIGELLIPYADSITDLDMVQRSGAFALRGTQLGLMICFMIMMVCVFLMHKVNGPH